jgi:hypothetical protein
MVDNKYSRKACHTELYAKGIFARQGLPDLGMLNPEQIFTARAKADLGTILDGLREEEFIRSYSMVRDPRSE